MRWSHSLRWRIQTWNGLLLTGVVAVMLTAFYRHEREQREAEARAYLLLTYHEALPDLLPPPGPRPPHRRAAWRAEFERRGGYWILGDYTGRVIARAGKPPEDFDAAELRDTASPATRYREGRFRMIAGGLPGGGALVLGIDPDLAQAELTSLGWRLAAGGITLLALAIGIGWWLAGRALRPIRAIGATAARIAAGDYATRLDPVEVDDEIGDLARVLDTTFVQLNAARERQAQFNADVAHELRTPVAAILTRTQLALSRERAAAEYREALTIVERVARRMRSLTEDLLELSKGDHAPGPGTVVDTDLATLAREAVELLAPLIAERSTALTESLDPAPLRGDANQLRRVIVNLLSNAIQHNASGCAVTLSTKTEGDRAVLVVADHGRGIPAEHREKIFDRFHRIDPSRSRDTGGAGLGLAIVKQLVEAHGGVIALDGAPGEGATFTVRLPRQRATAPADTPV